MKFFYKNDTIFTYKIFVTLSYLLNSSTRIQRKMNKDTIKSMKVIELKKLAKKLEIKKFSYMNKEQLIKNILENVKENECNGYNYNGKCKTVSEKLYCLNHRHKYRLEKPENCCICIDFISEISEIPLECGHWLHKECLKSTNIHSCPLCKEKLTKDEIKHIFGSYHVERNRYGDDYYQNFENQENIYEINELYDLYHENNAHEEYYDNFINQNHYNLINGINGDNEVSEVIVINERNEDDHDSNRYQVAVNGVNGDNEVDEENNGLNPYENDFDMYDNFNPDNVYQFNDSLYSYEDSVKIVSEYEYSVQVCQNSDYEINENDFDSYDRFVTLLIQNLLHRGTNRAYSIFLNNDTSKRIIDSFNSYYKTNNSCDPVFITYLIHKIKLLFLER